MEYKQDENVGTFARYPNAKNLTANQFPQKQIIKNFESKVLCSRTVFANVTNLLEDHKLKRPATSPADAKTSKSVCLSNAHITCVSSQIDASENDKENSRSTSVYPKNFDIECLRKSEIRGSLPTKKQAEFDTISSQYCHCTAKPSIPHICESDSRSRHVSTIHCPSESKAQEVTSSSSPINNGWSEEDGEIDRRPFKSKLACDIVRAAFADRVQLEDLLAECRRADFALSAVDRSPVDRMMEATDYIVGIMAYEQIRETKEYFHVGDFLSTGKQPNLTADMLTTLADWLVEVQENFVLNHETIHLAWGLLYAYLDHGEPLARREIQLMACAAVMVACKHEERQMPPLSDFLYITDNAYAKEDFIEAERRLLIAIDFAVHRPNPYVFLRRYARVLDANNGLVQFMSRFLLEAGMHSHTISLKRESRKAAAVLWLARVVLRNPSYRDWINRGDVRQLRHLICSNPILKDYYISCRQSSRHSTTSHPNFRANHLKSWIDSTHLPNNPNLSRTSSESSSNNDFSFESDFNSASMQIRIHANDSGFGSSSSKQSTNDSASSTVSGPCTPNPQQVINGLDPSFKSDLEAMQSEEEQRQPLWPPILEHITGYKEADLIPLALRYHTIAMRLIAEVARGGHLAREREAEQTEQPIALTVKSNCSHRPSETVCRTVCMNSSLLDDDSQDDPNSAANQRCVSPGGHYLRRQSVSKYCSSAFLSVANAYPQLAFDNFVPYFPAIQCPESCTCFVCTNLIRRNFN